jgi:hypothetical protein
LEILSHNDSDRILNQALRQIIKIGAVTRIAYEKKLDNFVVDSRIEARYVEARSPQTPDFSGRAEDQICPYLVKEKIFAKR